MKDGPPGDWDSDSQRLAFRRLGLGKRDLGAGKRDLYSRLSVLFGFQTGSGQSDNPQKGGRLPMSTYREKGIPSA